ncbi:MAG: hypothetical protein JHD33_05470 [Chthoniobacterales bacterium]|nr:hypothetical protein [Chthoniobacterales bacterium]
MPRFSRSLVRLACLFAGFAAHGAWGQMDEAVFTADLPFDASHRLPAWMHGPPVSDPGNSARVAFPLSPPPGRDLLVHFVFDEADGTNLRVEWLRDGSSTPEVVADNLGEGLGVPNQRPLLISASRLGGNGTLLLQGGGKLNVNRVRFEWVKERTMLASASRYVPVVVTASRLTLGEADVDGSPRPALQDEWRDRVVRAVLTEKTELLTPSITLVSALEQAPVQARFEASLAGVYLDQEVWLILNDQEVGPLAIDVPTLEDPGHLGLPGREAQFAGWRKANVHVSAHLLLPGENAVLLELRSPLNSGYRNKTYIRDAVLELCYPPVAREPDLTMPVRDLPASPVESAGVDEPLPPVSDTMGSPGEALGNFWRGGGGAL